MIVFFGTRAKVIPSRTLEHMACENCGNRTLQPYTMYRYFHIFWVPCFPFKKQIATECTHCQNSWVNKEVTPATRAAIARENKSSNPPAYLFAGLALIALFVGYVVHSERAQDKATAKYFASPMVDDFYVVDYAEVLQEMDEEEFHYGLFKVNHVEPDSIRFLVGTYGYRYPGDAKRAINDVPGETDYFYEGELAMAKNELQQLFEASHVKKIVRTK